MKKRAKKNTLPSAAELTAMAPDLETATSGPASTELTFEEAVEAASQPEAAPAIEVETDSPAFAAKVEAAAGTPLKEEKEKKVRKVAPAKDPETKPVNRIEKEGADFRLVIMGEKRGPYAFYTTAAHAFEAEVGRAPVKGEFPKDWKPETPPAVVNGCRISAADDGKGFNVYFNGKFAGWKPTLPEAEEFLTRVKTREAAKEAARAGAPPIPTEQPASTEKPTKPAKTESKRGKKAADPSPADPGAISPELAAHCAETVRQAGVEAEVGRIRESLITLKALSAGYGPDAIAKFLADLPEDLLRAEAERRGLLKPASSPAANGNGTKRSHPGPSEGHRELTKQAWVIARQLAAEKGGKPQDHMKEAWGKLVRD
ncbi:MAG: hypothetical protein ACLQVJ_00060 [Syntrophobacteraceae bacterium]